jgi:hypothetical protein
MAVTRTAVIALLVVGALGRAAHAGGAFALERAVRSREVKLAVRAIPADPGLSERLRLTRTHGSPEAPGRLAAGFRVAYVTDLHKMSSQAALADVSLRLPFGAERVELGAEVGAWSRRLRENEDDAMVTRSFKAMPIRSRILYQVPLAGLSLFGGIGCGVVMTKTEVSTASSAASTRSRAATAGGLFGARIRAGRGRVGLEVGWWHVSLDRPERRGSIAGLELSAGYSLSF